MQTQPSPIIATCCLFTNASFNDFLTTLKKQSFDDTKLQIAKDGIKRNNIHVDELIEVLKLFSFEDNKLELAKFAYKYTCDQNNYFKVYDVFQFDASKEELREYIGE